jgi:Derlin-2/3
MAEPQSVREMYESIKPVTRIWLTAAFAVTMGARFGVVDLTLLVFRPALIWKRFEIWRLVTTFFFLGMPSFNWLIRMYNL